MPVNEITDLTLREYVYNDLQASPETAFDNVLKDHILKELLEIQTALKSLSEAAIQATDQEPPKPKKGMVRFNVLPWNALGNNSSGLVVYNGTAWVAV
tara:strand:- start:552 stop:845 length:294 start_codon:yes stop_codon:yes gene_type:complete